MADIDGDGEPEILLGGVNDAPEYRQATFVVFDNRRNLRFIQTSRRLYISKVGSERRRRGFSFHGPVGMHFEFNRVSLVRVAPEESR